MNQKARSVKALFLLMLILINTLSLCGCWNYIDVEKLLIVSGVAIDKNIHGDKYLLTIEIIDYEMAGKEAKQGAKFIQSEGKTIFEAIRKVINIVGRKLYWSHADIVIVNEEIAKEGMIPVLDFVLRDPEVRSEMYILISKEKTAREVLLQDMLISHTSSESIANMLDKQKNINEAPDVQIYNFLNDMLTDGSVLPAIHLVDNMNKKTAAIAGTAIFKSDKLIGYLDVDESKYLLFIRNKVKNGLITLNENSSNAMDNITLEIFKSKTKVKPSYINNKLTMNIDIWTEVAIGEMATTEDFTSEKNSHKIKKDAADKIKSSIEKLVKNVQQKYDADIFDFGQIIKADKPKVWKQLESDWDKNFKDLNINVNVTIKIRNSGFSSKPIKKEE